MNTTSGLKQFFHTNRASLLTAFCHWALTWVTDRSVFTKSVLDEPFNYLVCKGLLFCLLFAVWSALIRRRPETMAVLKYAALYLIPISAVLLFKLPQGFLSNDESLIFAEASALADYTWFYYLTTYYYIVSMMLIPAWFGPILVKVAIQLLTAGYAVFRLSRFLNFRYGKYLYLSFLIPPVLAYTTSAHRIPVYFLLYLFLIFLLLMDLLEQKPVSGGKLFLILLLGAVLTQWRTEGIYFAVVLPILVFLTYPSLRTRKAAAGVILLSLLLQYLVSVPQNGFLPSRMGDKADNRMGPFYAYTITNMYRNGLDKEKNREDLLKVARYLDPAVLEAINRDLKDINYEDVLILYYPGYTGILPEADDSDYRAYTEGCRNIFLHNPEVFLKTRIGAFHYAATPYRISWKEGGIRGFLLFLVSIVKTLSYNLYPSHLFLFLLCLWSLLRRRPFTFFLTGGLICHFVIVFVLAPASYFKYYFPIYMTMYFYVNLIAVGTVWNRYHPERPVSFLP